MTAVIICQERAGMGDSEERRSEGTGLMARFLMAIKDKDLRQVVLAQAAHVNQATVSNWKTGKVIPRADEVARLLPHLGVNGHWLLTGKGPKDDVPATHADGVVEGVELAIGEAHQVLEQVRERYGRSRAELESLASDDLQMEPPASNTRAGQKPEPRRRSKKRRGR